MFNKKFFACISVFALIAILPFACITHKKATLDCTTIESTFSKDIQPILQENCYKCHGKGSIKGDFTTYEGIKIKVDNGELENEVLRKQEMPPTGPLPEEERKKIRCWLNNGAMNN
ncbi:MAG: cytochrome c [Bacteroidetes bacterium]|nr:cytochrome c [Bacteroidota bacterium]